MAEQALVLSSLNIIHFTKHDLHNQIVDKTIVFFFSLFNIKEK